MFLFEESRTKDGIQLRVLVESPQITDISNWPYFTVMFTGRPLQGKWLTPDAFQVGQAVYLRTPPGMSDEMVIDRTILQELHNRIKAQMYRSSPGYGYA